MVVLISRFIFLDGILKKYSKVGGVTELFKRTQTFLEDALNSGAATCLICIGTIKRVDKVCIETTN